MYILFKTVNVFPETRISFTLFFFQPGKDVRTCSKSGCCAHRGDACMFSKSYPECNIGIWLIEPGHLAEFLTQNVDRILLFAVSTKLALYSS